MAVISAPRLLVMHGSLTYEPRSERFQRAKVTPSSVKMETLPLQVPCLRIEANNKTIGSLRAIQTSSLNLRSPFFGSASSVNERSSPFLGSRVAIDLKKKDANLVHRGKHTRASVATAAFHPRFTSTAVKALVLADEETRRLGHDVVGSEHIFLGLLGEVSGIASKVLRSAGLTMKKARIEVENIIGRGIGFNSIDQLPLTACAKCLLEASLEEACKLGVDYIGSEHLLLGLLNQVKGTVARIFDNLGVDPKEIRKQVLKMIAEVPQHKESEPATNEDGYTDDTDSKKTFEYGTNLTKAAKEGKLDPVIGREKQIERVIQILGRRTKNNPCLIGEAGVGKTSIAEGLALRIVDGDVPDFLEGKQVIALDFSRIVSGTKYRGEFEDRLQKIIEEVKNSDNLIIFIDEIHTLVGAGAAEGAIDAANILKPALARGELQCIGATTLDEYRLHIEKDPALERRFQPVEVPEPTVGEAIQILRGIRERYETHHKLTYTDEALVAAAELASEYIRDRFLPDKAIDLIDEAGSRARMRHAKLPEYIRELQKELRQIENAKNGAVHNQEFDKADELHNQELNLKAQISAFKIQNNEMKEADMDDAGPVVTEADIKEIVFSWTGIPVQKVTEDESSRLLKLEDNLHERVIGQDEAVTAISRAIRRARTGLKDSDRLIASFIFLGPTGVGKSELAKALAACYFGSEDAMIRLDMSEFMERHTVSKLIGSPPGYVGYSEGGQLTEAVRRRPYTLILFDEIEKAHPDVFNLMLQILDDGRLTDSKGRIVSFKNTLIIMTSNIGSTVIEKGGQSMGFDLTYDNQVINELQQYFRPEFLNRLDDMIVFKQLTKLEVKQIADIMLKEVFKRLEVKGINVQVTNNFRDRVVEDGYSPTYGARHLRRAIMRLLVDSMAEKMLAKEIQEGDSVILDVDSSGNVVVLNSSSS